MDHEATHSAAMLARQFQDFARDEAHGTSPLYEQLCAAVADDPQLLAIAMAAASRPVPNLLLAAVQFLLRREPDHPLRAFYPTLGGTAPNGADPVPDFRAFCLERADAIRELLATRRVQTNEVRRCALLLPAFALASRIAPDRPLALIEFGASAGFNLLWDHYAYDYGTGQRLGSPQAVVQLTCRLRGDLLPPLPSILPRVASRLGIDLQPIDVEDPDAIDWLRALVWPEHLDRLALLDQAVSVARAERPKLLAGDALDLLAEHLALLPTDVLPCVYHTFTINQFSAAARRRLNEILDDYGARRDFACVSIAHGEEPLPVLRMETYVKGKQQKQQLAFCHPHGLWLQWRDEMSSAGITEHSSR